MSYNFLTNQRAGALLVTAPGVALSERTAEMREDSSIVIVALNDGYETVIDAEDAHHLGNYRWRVDPKKPPGKQYVTRRSQDRATGRWVNIWLHRLIAKAPPGVEVDHIDRNRLNNRRSNLRLCSRAQNNRNTGPHRNNTSGYKGVSRGKCGRWYANIRAGDKWAWIGSFATAEEAAKAYDKRAIELSGEFAWTNFPREEAADE